MLAAHVMEMILKCSQRSEKFSQKNQEECISYVIFTVLSCCGAFIFTDLKFSALMTFSAALQCLGFGLLFLQVTRGRGTKSISLRTLVLYVIVLSSRLYVTCQHDTYIPADRSGDYLYQTIEATSLVVVIMTLAKLLTLPEDDYPCEDKCGILGLMAVAGAAAMYVHPDLIQSIWPDTSWTFSLYLEVLAMVPQLFLITKLGGDVQSLQGHYIACTFASRLAMLRFYARSYGEMTPRGAGFGVIGSQVLQCLLLSDFMYLYVRSLRISKTCLIPLSG